MAPVMCYTYPWSSFRIGRLEEEGLLPEFESIPPVSGGHRRLRG
jgi:hypothetical protein